MKQFFKMTALALLTIGFLAACGKKGGNNSGTVLPGVIGNCVDCAGMIPTQAAIGQVQGAYATGTVELHGETYEVQRAMNEAMVKRADQRYTFNYYVGPVIISGTLNINSPIGPAQGFGNCVIPPGQYAVRTVSKGYKAAGGNWSGMGDFTVQDVVLDGARDIRVRIQDGLYTPTTGQVVMTFIPISGPQAYNPGVDGPCM